MPWHVPKETLDLLHALSPITETERADAQRSESAWRSILRRHLEHALPTGTRVLLRRGDRIVPARIGAYSRPHVMVDCEGRHKPMQMASLVLQYAGKAQPAPEEAAQAE